MTALVTGANGFVGAALCRALCAQGESVKAFVRKNADTSNLTDLPVELAIGDLRDPESLRQAIAGCRFVYHVAADYRLWIPDPDNMYATNVEGSRNVVRAAMDAGVERIVYTSSVAAIKPPADKGVADESSPTVEADMIGHYKRSKFLAEQAVSELVTERDAPVVIVNPSTPIGPGDIKPTPTGRIVLDSLRGRMPAYIATGLNLVHVDDVADGHIAACNSGQIGRRYILGGEDVTLQKFLQLIAEYAGHKPPALAIPHPVAILYAGVSEIGARITGKEPAATIDAVRMAKRFMFYSNERACAELNFHPRSAQASVEAAVDWFRTRFPA